MRVLFTSDWHLGKVINNYSMLENQVYVLDQIEKIVVEKAIDVVVIAGDIYDRSVPSKEAIQVFDGFVSRMIHQKKKVIIISGNHDSYERLAFGIDLFKESGFYIGKKFDGVIDYVTLTDQYGPINFYLIPYISYQEVRQLLNDDSITTFHIAYEKMLSTIKLNDLERNILIHHSYVVSNVIKPETSDSEKLLSLGGADFVDASLFKDFDYVALGHVHKPQRIANEFYRYSGSILKYSFSEANHQKSVTIVDFTEKSKIKYEQVELKPLHDLVIIKDKFANIMDNLEHARVNQNNFVKIVLTDEEDIIEPFPKLKSLYPLLMELQYEVPRIANYLDYAISEDLANKILKREVRDFSDVTLAMFKEFTKTSVNYNLTSEDEKIIKEIAQEVIKGGMFDED